MSEKTCAKYLDYRNTLLKMSKDDTIPYYQQIISILLEDRVGRYHYKSCIKK